MLKFCKVSLIAILIFVCGCFGFKLSNNNSKSSFFEQPTISATLPENYDLRDYIDIGVENQHNLGICYAFASLTSLETYLALNYGEYYDFSELHFATALYLRDNYYSSVNEALTNGGNFSHFTLYSQKDKSIVLEDEMPMDDYITLSSSVRESRLVNDFNTINNNFYSIAKVNDTVSFPQYVGPKNKYNANELESFRNKIKNHIMNYGSLTAGIYTSSSGFTFNTRNYKITNDSLVIDQSTINSNINHLISIVGWDDDYNANGTWANPGAYICLNSWGTSFGDDGYFYVSYDDYFIESTIQGITNASLCTTNNKISSISNHQNKTAIYNHVFDEPYPTIYTANIFNTSNYLGENITHIDSFIKGGITKFYIKFFSTYDIALASINSVNSSCHKDAIRLNDYTLSTKYQLSTPLNISNKYMVVVREIHETAKTHSLAGNKSDKLNIEPTYYHANGLGNFNLNTDLWQPGVTGRSLDYTIPLILHTDKQYVQVSNFDSTVDSMTTSGHIKNNAIIKNKTLNLKLNNANISSTNLSNITIKKLFNNEVDVTSNFNFEFDNSTLHITMINSVNNIFSCGEYLITIPCSNTTIYRVIEVQDAVTYTITYHLDGGVANNPNIYTSKQTSLNLQAPTKNGFMFVGWFTNSDLTVSFDPNNLPYKNIVLYAKYDISTPSIISKSKDVSISYYKGINVVAEIVAHHHLVNEFNTLTYQWYKASTLNGDFKLVESATSSTLNINNVAQSGYYACAVTININDTSIGSACTKTLNPSFKNAIHINIKPYIYDMSKVKWDYSEAFSYDTKTHIVSLVNLPTGVTVEYTNNCNNTIGTYTASATLVYDNMDGNAIASPVENLNWQIRPAKIKIEIDNIIVDNALNNNELQQTYSCSISNEYLPDNINTLQQKIKYLNLKYILQSTDNDYIKIINASTDSFDIYDITIIPGEYRIVIHTISDNNIIATNDKGFAKDCLLTTTKYQISNNTLTALNDKNLKFVEAYNCNFSYLKNDTVSITIPLTRSQLMQGLSVYMLVDGKLTKLDSSFSSTGLTFNTSNPNGTYIIVKQDLKLKSNAQMIVLVLFISIYVGLITFAIIGGFKHKHNYY